MASPFVARTKQARLKLRDDRPQLGANGNPVLLTCGCQLMREPDISTPERRWWCSLHHGWHTHKR